VRQKRQLGVRGSVQTGKTGDHAFFPHVQNMNQTIYKTPTAAGRRHRSELPLSLFLSLSLSLSLTHTHTHTHTQHFKVWDVAKLMHSVHVCKLSLATKG
jgi:hypothetical protein